MQKAISAMVILLLVCSGLLALSGYGISASIVIDTVDPTLNLISPNGGEEWYIGDAHNINWAASDNYINPNSVDIEYSLNGGTEYVSLVEATLNDGSHPWNMPAVETYNARVRVQVSDYFGNTTQKASAQPFSITYVPPMPPDGVSVDTSNNVDAVITWQAVTENIYHYPLEPDGYIVLYNETPYEDDQYYYFLAMTTGLSHTHPNVARFRDQMFYKVLAFKDYRGALQNIVQPAIINPDLKLNLASIKQALRTYPEVINK